jgi:hypothetical protein
MRLGEGTKYTQDVPRGLKKGAHKVSALGWEKKVYLKEIYCV